MRRPLHTRALALLLSVAMVFAVVVVATPSASAYTFSSADTSGKTDRELIDSLFNNTSDETCQDFLLLWLAVAYYGGFDVQTPGNSVPETTWTGLLEHGNPTVTRTNDGNYIFSTKEETGSGLITITFVNPHFVLDDPSGYGTIITKNSDEEIINTRTYENRSDTAATVESTFSSTVSTELTQTASTSMANSVGTEVSVSAKIAVVDLSVSVSYNFTHTTETSKALAEAQSTTLGSGTTVTLQPWSYVTVTTSEATTTNTMPYNGSAHLVYGVIINGDNRTGSDIADAINQTWNENMGLNDLYKKDEILVFGYADGTTAMSDVAGAIGVYAPNGNSQGKMGGSYNGFTWTDYDDSGSKKAQAQGLYSTLYYLYEIYGQITAEYKGSYIFTSKVTKQTVSGMSSLLALSDMQIDSGGIQVMEDGWYNITNLAVNTADSRKNSPYVGFTGLTQKWYIDPSPTLSDYTDAQTFYDELPASDGVADIWTNPSTGQTYVRGLSEGTTYLNLAVLYKNPEKSYVLSALTTADTMNQYVKITVIGKPRASDITLTGEVWDYYLTSSADSYTVNFPGGLSVSARDQFGDPYGLDEGNCDWAIWEPNAADFTVVSGGTFVTTNPGVYYVYAVDPDTGAYSNPISFEVFPEPKPVSLTLSGEIEEMKLGVGDVPVTVDLAELNVEATDQYNALFGALDETNCEWVVYFPQEEGTDAADFYSLSGSDLTILRAGSYGVQAKYTDSNSGEDILSENVIWFVVLDAPVAAEITISGEIPALDTNDKTKEHSYGLSQLEITLIDQYSDDFTIDPSLMVWEIVQGEQYASIFGDVITGLVQGSGELRLVYDGRLYSNNLSFEVQALPYVKELFQSVTADFVVEGVEYDLTEVPLTAKDQWGEEYSLSDAQIASLEWSISNNVTSTVETADVTLTGSKLEVATGAVTYAGTGTLILTATLPDRGDGNASTAVFVTLRVRQAAVPTKLTIGLIGDTKLWSGQNALVSEFFTISALDQYGEDFAITPGDVDWTSSDATAYEFSVAKGNLVISAKDENGTADISVSMDIIKQDLKTALTETVTSNVISMEVPGVRRVDSISVSGAPASAAFGSTLNVGALTPVIYDTDGVAFTSEELAGYPAMVTWTIDPGNTGSTFNASTGKITFGNTRGTMILTAMVVNASSQKLASTTVEIQVCALHSAYISGYSDGSFRPDKSITRAEAAQMFYLLAKADGYTPSSGSSKEFFPDVKKSDWYYDAVKYLADIGVASGYPDETFKPNSTITRAEFIAMAMRLIELDAISGTASFTDVPKSHWAAGYIAAARDAGYISGYPNGSFGPEKQITRAEAVTILGRIRGCDGLSKGRSFTDVPKSHWAYKAITAAATEHIH